MNEIVKDIHLMAPLTGDEYIQLKVAVAKANTTLKDWVAEAIREKLNKENNNDNR